MTATVDIKHRAYNFAKETIGFVSDKEYKHIFHSMIDQLIRSSKSVGANLVEGYAGSSKNDFVKFYTIALKSSNETKYWICLIRDTIWKQHSEQLNNLLKEADELSKIIATIIIKTKGLK